MNLPTELSAYADWAQIIGLPLAFFVLVIAVYTLTRVMSQLREMVRAQRAQSGPLLSISFSEAEERSPNIIGELFDQQVRFIPKPPNNIESAIVGELRSPGEKRSQSVQALNVRIENVQKTDNGVAHSIKIEFIGWWGSNSGDGNWTSGFIHLFSIPFSLNPGEVKESELVWIDDVGYYLIFIRSLEYFDLWGHKARAFLGETGTHQYFLSKKQLPRRPYFSTTPDEGADAVLYHQWELRRDLAKEWLRVFETKWRKRLSRFRMLGQIRR